MIPRPAGWTNRDILCGVLVGAAVHLKLPAAVEQVARVCEPMFAGYQPDMRRWYPSITIAHAQAAIAYAGRARSQDAITLDEYTFVCDKVRRAIFAKTGIPEHFNGSETNSISDDHRSGACTSRESGV